MMRARAFTALLLVIPLACSSSTPGTTPPREDASSRRDAASTDAVATTDSARDAAADAAADAWTDGQGSELPSNEALAAWLQPVFAQGYVHGMVVGVLDATGSAVYGFGTVGTTEIAPTGDTIFQIGSVSKTFTGLLLASQVAGGALSASEPVQNLLPASVTVPTWHGLPITLQDLTTHTSGLPDAPTNLTPTDPLNPWAGYSVQDLYTFLNGYALPYAPGTQFVYSDVGEGLLGLALSLKAGTTYDGDVQSVIAGPLGLVDTTSMLSASQQPRLAPAYDGDLNPIEAWTFTEADAPAGALRSTVNDLLVYGAAQAGVTTSPIAAAMTLSHKPITQSFDLTDEIGYNWIVSPGNILWHNGGLYGGAAFVGFDPVEHKVVAILLDTGALNTPTPVFSDVPTSLGLLLMHWLQGTPPPPVDTLLPALVSVPTQTLANLVGTYDFSGMDSMQVTLNGDTLEANADWLWYFPAKLYPTSATTFNLRAVQASVSFEVGGDGGASGLTLTAEGQSLQGTKS